MNPDDSALAARVRAVLAAARPGRPADALAELPGAREIVPRLPVVDLHRALHEQGVGYSLALLEIASPAQLRALVDLDAWRRDAVAVERLDEWLDALFDTEVAGAARKISALDPELIEWLLRTRARVHDLSAGDDPGDTVNPLWATPDGFFACEIVAPPGDAQRTLRLLELLLAADPARLRSLLLEARAATSAELEETAYRMRSARMGDLGFPDIDDARAVYRPLDPREVRLGEGTEERFAPPAEPHEARAGSWLAPVEAPRGDFFSAAVAGIADAGERERLGHALVLLVNRVLWADGAEPADVDARRAAMERVRDTLALGLEAVCRGNAGQGPRALATVALGRLFGAAIGTVERLRRLAATLARTGPRALDPPWRETVLALSSRPPLLSRALDDPPADGARPFRSLDDVRRATAALEEAGAAVEAAAKLGASLATARLLAADGCVPHPDDLTLGDLVRTILAQAALGHDAVLAPLSGGDVELLLARAFDRDAAARRIEAAAPGAAGARVAVRWIDPLAEELARLRPPIEPRGVSGLLVRLRPPARG